jgi:hypothetical protein
VGIHFLRRVGDLGSDVALSPERFDPRRSVGVAAGAEEQRLGELVRIVTANVTSQSFPPEREVLVLDTTHAYEGFVLHRHAPVKAVDIGSAKRLLEPGDVLVSRLRPYLRQIAYVDEELFRRSPQGNEVCASSEFFVLRARGELEVAALVPFLLSSPVQAALAAGQEGGHHPRFSKELLASLPVPEIVLSDAAKLARSVVELAAGVRGSLEGCHALVRVIERQMRTI